jgi:protein-tyrosine phosphatase
LEQTARLKLNLFSGAGSLLKARAHALLLPLWKRKMDITWITERIAVGGGIWTDEKMGEVARRGITHIIDMQIEFDDTSLAEPHGIAVLWNPVDDDFRHKSPSVFRRGVEFALQALDGADAKLYIHCAAGIHRAPMMTLAVMGVLGWKTKDAMMLVEARRPVVDFAPVYVESVERFLRGYLSEGVDAAGRLAGSEAEEIG